MQAFRNQPALAVGLLILAIVAVFLSWFLFMRTSEPKVEPVTPPPVQQNPNEGQGQLL
ncbi:MAG: hypothetical protein KatS3mg020_0919 [Fimbriimonadales bacterium]|nr:MAG: hypothetical protein KatS3mg020_0919 [Fimbriimonadales bacterium]